MVGTLLEIDDYKAAETQVREFAQAAGIRPGRVGKFGRVNWPGISDLDIAVVGKKEELILLRGLIAKERLSNEKFNFIMFHDPVYILEEVAPLAFGFHTLQGLEKSTRNYLSSVARNGIEAANGPLRIAWFFFLSEVLWSDIHRSRNGLQERRSLLIHRNFEETIRWLLPEYVCRNDGLRGSFMNGKKFKAEEELIQVQALAQDLVFKYLRESFFDGQKYERLRFLASHRRFAALVASEEEWRSRSVRKLALLHAPKGAIPFLTALSSTSANGISSMAVYRDIVREVYSAYKGTSLPLPYVSPLGLI